MKPKQLLNITLPNEMAEAIKTKVRAGEYATESEVIREGVLALLNRDRSIETWLQNEVGSAYDALKSNPSRAVTADQVRERLASENAKVS
jgi:antitoxin ParD1/3/4